MQERLAPLTNPRNLLPEGGAQGQRLGLGTTPAGTALVWEVDIHNVQDYTTSLQARSQILSSDSVRRCAGGCRLRTSQPDFESPCARDCCACAGCAGPLEHGLPVTAGAYAFHTGLRVFIGAGHCWEEPLSACVTSPTALCSCTHRLSPACRGMLRLGHFGTAPQCTVCASCFSWS